MLRPGSTSGVKDTLEEVVKSMEVPDPYTFVLHLKKVAPEVWRTLFALGQQGAPIVCKKYIETVGEDKARWEPIGSGPYRLVEHKTGQYLKFQA
jgi:ABC-type transport system substrate-binding protein